MNKKFGVSYNIFSDSIELLEHSIKCIREHVDHINVVYQTVSNMGLASSEPIEDIVNDLLARGLVDEVYCFKPKVQRGPHANECEKRQLGSYISANAGCHYHMCADADELYNEKQFVHMKNTYLTDNLVAGYAQMQTFYKSTEYVLDPPETYYVSLFYDISNGDTYAFNAPCEVLVDPTRKMVLN